MFPSHGVQRRPARHGRRDRATLARQALRRCLPCLPLLRRLFNIEGPRVRRLCVRALLILMMLLLALLTLLLSHLLIAENALLAKYLHLSSVETAEATGIAFPLAGSTPEELRAVQEALKPYAPRLHGPRPRSQQNGFQPSYFDLEERALPLLTPAALRAWSAHNSSATDVAEEVLLQHSEETRRGEKGNVEEKEEAEDFFNLLAFMHPPQQQQRYYRTALNDILGFGTRVGGAHRESLLHHLLREGLGQRYFDAEHRRYHASAAVHLSEVGRKLLEKTAPAWPSSPQLGVDAERGDDGDAAGARVAGWRWSLMWDNFTVTVPDAVQLTPPVRDAAVTLRNLVFQFPGGAQFRRKRVAAAQSQDVFVGRRRRYTPTDGAHGAPSWLFEDERHPLDGKEEVYTQEFFIGRGRPMSGGIYLPELRRGVPGTRAPISVEGHAVPLKPSLSAAAAEPVAQQPVQHAVYAAHWDSMLRSDVRFLGACDSAMPMVFLLRTMRNIAVLTDVAEALTESFRADLVEGDAAAVVPEGVVVPGLTHTFRNATTEAEVRRRLAHLLSPAHHALLYQYYFARPYTAGSAAPGEAATSVEVDVRMWLDWVQHLPTLSLVLFDGEEAFEKWAGNDHTYGSRHLARRWRAVKTMTQTRYSGGPQSLFDSVDLFALYDLMGTAGTSFHNYFPTQSGIYYAALAQKETEQRKRALRYATAITAELLWRVLGTARENTTTTTPSRGASVEDAYVRQLGSSVDVAIAAVDRWYVAKVLSNVTSRPSLNALPRPWLLYGAPHEMLTLHRLSLQESRGGYNELGALEAGRQYDAITPGLAEKPDFRMDECMESFNRNIFFDALSAAKQRRNILDAVVQDDHLHWLDTQRVLHLISFPFPQSWHTERDDGRDIHDGTSVDLANVLWSAVLELGHYWTGEGRHV